jgi:hypothetical protein
VCTREAKHGNGIDITVEDVTIIYTKMLLLFSMLFSKQAKIAK